MTSRPTLSTQAIAAEPVTHGPAAAVRHAPVVTHELGTVTVVAAGKHITGLYFPGHWTRPDSARWGVEVPIEADPLLTEAGRQLHEYLRGERRVFDLPTQASGNALEEKVWALLAEIPFGETATYGELAERLGDKSMARVVGQAVGHNPLSILVGCHRVVGSSHKLTGYAGGLERKTFLLTLEGHDVREARGGPVLVPAGSPDMRADGQTPAQAVTLF